MKNLLVLFSLFLSHQLWSQAHLGASLTNGSELGQWGAQVEIGYQFNQWGVKVSYGEFFENQITMRPSMVNIDVNYQINTKTILIPYTFIGLNLLKAETMPADDLLNYGTYGGLNLGIGGYFNFNLFQPFTEAKFVTGELSQWYVSAGLRFRIPR